MKTRMPFGGFFLKLLDEQNELANMRNISVNARKSH